MNWLRKLLGPSESALIARLCDYRPGQQLLIDDLEIARTTASVLNGDSDGKKGPLFSITGEGVIERIAYNEECGCVLGVSVGMSAADVFSLYPDMEMHDHTAGANSRPPRDYYVGPCSQTDWEISILEVEDAVRSFSLATAGYHRKQKEHYDLQKAEQQQKIAMQQEANSARHHWKTLTNIDDMLIAWAEVAQPGKPNLVRKLMAASPSQWYEFLDEFNWDDGLAPFFWIVDQRNAPIEVIFEIFSRSEPDYFCNPVNRKKRKEDGFDEYALIDEIEQNISSGHYTAPGGFDGVLAWDTASLGLRDADYMARYRNIFRRKYP